MTIKDIRELTPVETGSDGVFYKRDDKFQPFGERDANGGKTRQCLALIESIKDKHAGVVTHSSVHSPQGYIVTRVAKHFGMKSIVTCGGTKPETLYTQHHMPRMIQKAGGEIKIVCGTGMKGPVEKRSIDLAKALNYYWISFAINSRENPGAIFEVTSNQAENMPDDLDNLVIPVGSGIQMAGILLGMARFEKTAKNIFGVHVGPDRRKSIDSYLSMFKYDITRRGALKIPDYNLVPTGDAYSRLAQETIPGIEDPLDELYEGKAMRWLKTQKWYPDGKTLFWIVGKRISEEDSKKYYGV